MKVLDDTLTVMPQCAFRIAAALRKAAATVAEQGATFSGDVTACADAMRTGMAALRGRLGALPGLLDPAPVIASCADGYASTVTDLRRLADAMAAVPARLLQQCAAAEPVLRGAGAAVAACGADPIAAGNGALAASLRLQIGHVDAIVSSLAQQGAASDGLFDDCAGQLDQLGQRLAAPLAAARAQVDTIIAELGELGTGIDALTHKALSPLDVLDAQCNTLAETLRALTAAIGETVDDMLALLAQLEAAVEQATATLGTLPAYFDPVRGMIADAVALINDIAQRIPGFVAAAESALDTAAAELDQAEALCDDAITICTRYMMRSPPLMAARVLFAGVKAMLPGVKQTITAARGAVRTAGTQASGLMQQAVLLVEALNPVLDEAVAQLKAAIDVLTGLLTELRAALRQAATAMAAIPPKINAQIDSACATARGVVAQMRDAANACIEQLQCKQQVANLQTQLSALSERTLAPLEARLRAAVTSLHEMLSQGKAGAQQAVAAATGGLNEVGAALRDVLAKMLADTPVPASLLARCDVGADSARQGLAQIQSAADAASGEARRAGAGLDGSMVGDRIGASFSDLRQQSEQAIAQAESALSTMNGSCERARAEADKVAADYATANEALAADGKDWGTDATEAANQARQAEREVAAGIADASGKVDAAATKKMADTTALKDKAQAGCNAALARVEAVQAQVNAARTDVISAEAMVDAEVVKQGGASFNDKAADGQGNAAAQASPATAGAAKGSAVAGAEAAASSPAATAATAAAAAATGAATGASSQPAATATSASAAPSTAAGDVDAPASPSAAAGGAGTATPKTATAPATAVDNGRDTETAEDSLPSTTKITASTPPPSASTRPQSPASGEGDPAIPVVRTLETAPPTPAEPSTNALAQAAANAGRRKEKLAEALEQGAPPAPATAIDTDIDTAIDTDIDIDIDTDARALKAARALVRPPP